MSRRHSAEKRQIMPDSKYESHSLSKFINNLMHDGKKSIAEAIVYGALEQVESKIEGKTGIEIFNDSLNKVKPQLEVKSRRVGGSTYQIPVEVRDERRLALAIRWIIGFARKRGEKGMAQKMAAELLDATNNRGTTIKKKEDTHKMAEANKAFAHFRW